MTSNPLRIVGNVWRACALFGLLALVVTGCGFKIAGPGESISIKPLATEDLADACTFDMNLPDQPMVDLSQPPDPKIPAPTQVAALVVYERGDSGNLFNDPQIQTMAAALHMVTVFAHQCNSKATGDIQVDATKGQGRALFAALTQYATDSKHPEIANLKVVLSGFSAAGVLTTTMVNAYPDRVLGLMPYASGSRYTDMVTVPVSTAAAQIPALVLANAYDPDSGVQRSLRYFMRGWKQGAPWGFGVQNHTSHCCTTSTRDLIIPWISAIVRPLESSSAAGATAANSSAAQAGAWSQAAPNSATVRFLCYTDGYYDAYGESNCWIYTASILPSTAGGPQIGWLPDASSAAAWLKWVTSPGTN